MELITKKPVTSFDLDKIKRGYLLWAKHSSWPEGKAGFVTAATERQLVVQYYPGIGNVTNHFRIPVSEAAAEQWEMRWSADMSEIYRHGADTDSRLPEPEESRK